MSSAPHSDHATPITLQPNSLYICLVQIPIPDKFHWALYITDAQGTATCHQWTENAAAQALGKVEGYKIDRLTVVTDMASDFVQNIAFIRLDAYAPPSFSSTDDVPGPKEYMARLFGGIFEGYPTIFENRKKGVTCRTWLMRALERLRVAGHFPGLDSAQVAAFEQAAIAVGRRAEVPVEVDGNMRIVTEVASI